MTCRFHLGPGGLALLVVFHLAGCDDGGPGDAPDGGGAGLDAAAQSDAAQSDAGSGGEDDAGPTGDDAGPDATTPDGGGPVTCSADEDCESAEYCRRLEGCEGEGTCEERPSGCTREYVPVCGCDGETYANACTAAEAGVSVAAPGECGGPEECLRNDQCARAEYCEGRSCGGPGACVPRPVACPDVVDPVCGCDGRTYSNSCEAAAAGVRVVASGACESAPVTCDDNGDCGRAQYCEGRSCGGPGACVPRPTECLPERAPVCGCDGTTYDSACEAARAGARVTSAGPCPSVPTDCASNRECAPTAYCAAEGCAGPGACTPRPGTCPAVVDPVCGCDGTTYDNSCLAASAGVRVARAGRCDAPGACTSNRECADTAYCEGRSCAGPGSCEPRPTACSREYVPVCGCDGRTYQNACTARAAGVRVARDGECVAGPAECTSDADCGPRTTCVTCRGGARVCMPRGTTC